LSINLPSDQLIRPNCPEDGKIENNTIFVGRVRSNDWFVHLTVFCYTDTVGTRYGPIFRLFKWRGRNLDKVPVVGDDKDLAMATRELKRLKILPVRFF